MVKINFLELLEGIFNVIWAFITELWWIWLLVFFIIIIKLLFSYLKNFLDKRRLEKWMKENQQLESLRKLSPKDFEKLTTLIFKKMNYKTKMIGGAGDMGIDVIIEKDDVKGFIQCKNMERVNPGHVREFWGSISDKIDNKSKSYFVTSGFFSQESIDFIKDKPIELIDGQKLIKYLHLAEK